VRRTFLGIVCVGIVLAGYGLRKVFNPLLIALMIAYILNPVANWLENRRIRRALAVTLIYVLVLAPCVAGLIFVGTLVWADAKKLPSVLFTEEVYEDVNGNGRWDGGDELTKDVNENGQYDDGDEFTDRNGNGKYDLAEPVCEDVNGNDEYDPGLVEKAVVALWASDEFRDLDGDQQYDGPEPITTDTNENGKYDDGDNLTKDVNENGQYDEAEGDQYEDVNNNGKFDVGDQFDDLNENGKYDSGDPLTFDRNGNGRYDVGLLKKLWPLVHRGTGATEEPSVSAVIGEVRKLMTGKWKPALDVLSSPFAWLQNAVGDALMLVVNVVLVAVYVFFFLLEMNVIRDTLFEYLPGPTRETVTDVLMKIHNAVSNFFRGRLIVCGIVGALTAIVMALLKVRFAILLGLLTGVGNLVPFLGVVIGLFPAALLSYIDFHEPLRVGFVVMGFVIVQWLEGMVLTPVIMGREVEMHPVTLIVALLIGGQVFGLFGVLIAVPLACILKILGREFVLPELRQLARDRE